MLPKIINSDLISEDEIDKLIPRSIDNEEIKNKVLEIINKVKHLGDLAIIKFSKEFDDIELHEEEIKVSEEEIQFAYKEIDNELLDSLRYAKKNLIYFHRAQKKESWSIEVERGVFAGQIYRPLESVGIYIPGRRAIYPSTVLMAVTPAYIAGVKNITICSPPKKNKRIPSEIIVAAAEFGYKDIYKVGGAQAIAAMAYGTKIIPKVQKIIGPGNKWVNLAKQLLSNVVAIDTPAGPSEILIIADQNTDYELVILDLISQIEHDPDNIGILVTDSNELIEKVKKELPQFVNRNSRRKIIKKALEKKSLIIKAKDLKDCIRVSNLIAPEHLEILIFNPDRIIDDINNAGAIFLGPYSPVSVGDYCAGTNHILPTGGYARTYSGLNIYNFLKIIDVLKCSEQGLEILSRSALKLAEFEGLIGHKKSIEKRLKKKN
ncbi:MAG: histidinol dehydrogenase [Candidatus Hodarchaeota archaeon]